MNVADPRSYLHSNSKILARFSARTKLQAGSDPYLGGYIIHSIGAGRSELLSKTKLLIELRTALWPFVLAEV